MELTPYRNKKMRVAEAQERLLKLKEEGLRLENVYKTRQIEKIELEIAALKNSQKAEIENN